MQETQTNWETTILDEAWKRRFVFHYKPLGASAPSSCAPSIADPSAPAALLQAQGLAPMGPPPPLAGLKPEPEPAPAPAPAALAPNPALGQVPLAPAPAPAPGLVPTPGSAHARALWMEPPSQPVPVLAPTHVRNAEEARRARAELDGDGRKRVWELGRDGESPPKRQRLAPAPSNSAPSLVEVKPRVVDFSRVCSFPVRVFASLRIIFSLCAARILGWWTGGCAARARSQQKGRAAAVYQG